MDCVFVNEEIRHDKERKCGWAYRKLRKRIDYKTKKTRFYTYEGYCQWDNRDYDEDTSVEYISIYRSYRHFKDKKKCYEKDIRNVEYIWGKGYKFEKISEELCLS